MKKLLLEGTRVVDLVRDAEIKDDGSILATRLNGEPVIFFNVTIVDIDTDIETQITPTDYIFEGGLLRRISKKYTKKAFFDLFTTVEKMPWLEALETPFSQATQTQKMVKLFNMEMQNFEHIDVLQKDTKEALQALAYNGILPVDKVNTIIGM